MTYLRLGISPARRHVFGTGDTALNHNLLAGYERHADDMTLEKVDGCGHFIADEMPDLVAERAREFFAG